MSRLFLLAALLLTLAACGKEEPAAPPADEPVAAEFRKTDPEDVLEDHRVNGEQCDGIDQGPEEPGQAADDQTAN